MAGIVRREPGGSVRDLGARVIEVDALPREASSPGSATNMQDPSCRFAATLARLACAWATVFVFTMGAPTSSAVVVVSNLSEVERDFNTIDSALFAAQSFETDAQDYELVRVRSIIGGELGASGAFVELRRATPAGIMDTSPAGFVASFTLPDLSGPRSIRDLVPATPVTLSASTRYYVLFGATGPGSYEWAYAEGNGSTGPGSLPQFQYSFDGGGLWSIFASENPFFLEVEAGSVEEFVLVSNVTEPVRSFNTIDSALWAAQSFETDGQAYALTSVRALVGNELSTSGAFVELRSSTPIGTMETSPAGLVATLSLPDLTGPRALRSFLPPTPIGLEPNTRYHLLFGASGPGSYEWSYAEGNGQMGPGTIAQFQYSFDGGGLWSIFASENPFHVEVRALPEPSLGVLVASSLVAIASLRRARGRLRRDSSAAGGESAVSGP